MIAYLNGIILKKTIGSVIIEANGVGYEVFVPLSTFYSLPESHERVSLHIYTHVREDALHLYGFLTELEKKLFLMLISVSGIGPRLSMNILSGTGAEELLTAVASGDSCRLKAIPGIGKKTSERIALELKEYASKILDDQEAVSPVAVKEENRSLVDDAISALLNLGYPEKRAMRAVLTVQRQEGESTLEDLIRAALKILA
jgi:Holliday junction DNA helicase RuvA